MKAKALSAALAATLILATPSCYMLKHQVGNGAQGTVKTSERQWYALWGLIPLNTVDSKKMAGAASDYTVESKITFIDGVIGFFTGLVSIVPQSVEVQK